jgi:hypothetical protein
MEAIAEKVLDAYAFYRGQVEGEPSLLSRKLWPVLEVTTQRGNL